MMRHGCYNALLASYVEIPDTRTQMNTVPLHHYVSIGGFASLHAFHVHELNMQTFAKVSAFTDYVSLNCCSFT